MNMNDIGSLQKIREYQRIAIKEDAAQKIVSVLTGALSTPKTHYKLILMVSSKEGKEEAMKVFSKYPGVDVREGNLKDVGSDRYAAVSFLRETLEHLSVSPAVLRSRIEKFFGKQLGVGNVVLLHSEVRAIPYVFYAPIDNKRGISLYIASRALFRILKCMGDSVPKNIAIPSPPIADVNQIIIAYNEVYLGTRV